MQRAHRHAVTPVADQQWLTFGANLGLERSSRQPVSGARSKEEKMLYYAVVFLIIALVAGVFGFGGIAAGAVGIAKILFFVFVVMAVVTFIVSLMRGR
jgi:uncharacterized membrane protein YtjA (UPF0391 family)